MQTQSIKEQAHRLLDNLPDSATWDDLMYRIYVRQAIEAGIKDSDQGRTVDVKEVRKRFGLPTRTYTGPITPSSSWQTFTNTSRQTRLRTPNRWWTGSPAVHRKSQINPIQDVWFQNIRPKISAS
jgi:hypothetical protein